jgi:hypothetical protein
MVTTEKKGTLDSSITPLAESDYLFTSFHFSIYKDKDKDKDKDLLT